MADENLDARVRLTEQLWGDPETRPLIEQAILKKHPNAITHMPGHAAREAIAAEKAEVVKLRDETKELFASNARNQALEAARRSIMDDPALAVRPEELPDIEKLMTEETIGSHKVAA